MPFFGTGSKEQYYRSLYEETRKEKLNSYSNLFNKLVNIIQTISINIAKFQVDHYYEFFETINIIIGHSIFDEKEIHLKNQFNSRLEFCGDYPCIDALLTKMNDLIKFMLYIIMSAERSLDPRFFSDMEKRVSRIKPIIESWETRVNNILIAQQTQTGM